MKAIKSLVIALALCVSMPAMAQFVGGGKSNSASSDNGNKSYNRVAVSYNLTNYSPNVVGIENIGLNGVGINYIHGFSLSETFPVFVEVGGNLNFDMGSRNREYYEGTYDDFWIQQKEQYQDINLHVPVNLLWKFKFSENFSLDSYFGLNFKLHLSSTVKPTYESDLSSDELDEVIDYNDFPTASESLFDEDVWGKDSTWNRFQMGWRVGLGANYKKFYLGLEYGTDFIPAFSNSRSDYKINTSTLKVSLGYTF